MALKQAPSGSSLQKRAQALLDGQYDEKANEIANTASSESYCLARSVFLVAEYPLNSAIDGCCM
jgi:hypothetical protein